MTNNESIKKYSLKYVHCQQGGLHTGQVMNLVCVDSACTHRGLICPICRMEHHQSHQTLPIKTFLEQIRSMFLQSDSNNEDLNNLSDYLRALDNSKKQIICSLKSQVQKIAKSFKVLQQKIQESFNSIRKNVMIQSSVTTKLPTLLTLLTEENADKDPNFILEQFKKYTQLLKYEKDKLLVSDKAKSLVQKITAFPLKFDELLCSHSSDLIKKLENLPKFFEQRQNSNKPVQNSSETGSSNYTFSTENKYFDILLQENNKLAKIGQQVQENGFIFVNENKGAQKQKIIVEIVSSMSQTISIGMGSADDFRNTCSFINDGTMQTVKQRYDFLSSTGTKPTICEDSSDEEPSEGGYVLGDILQIEYNGTQIVYFNRITQYKHTSKTSFNEQTKNNLQFVIGLGEGDSVRILDQ